MSTTVCVRPEPAARKAHRPQRLDLSHFSVVGDKHRRPQGWQSQPWGGPSDPEDLSSALGEARPVPAREGLQWLLGLKLNPA